MYRQCGCQHHHLLLYRQCTCQHETQSSVKTSSTFRKFNFYFHAPTKTLYQRNNSSCKGAMDPNKLAHQKPKEDGPSDNRYTCRFAQNQDFKESCDNINPNLKGPIEPEKLAHKRITESSQYNQSGRTKISPPTCNQSCRWYRSRYAFTSETSSSQKSNRTHMLLC